MRKLFKLRTVGHSLVKHIIGNGEDTFFWLDNWHEHGPLYKLLDDRTISLLGRALFAKVSSVIQNGHWHWPRPRSHRIQQIQNSISGIMLPQVDRNDDVVWTASPTGKYSTKHTWEFVRRKRGKVLYAHVIWFSQNVPKWAFILWLTCVQKLSKKDRLRRWGMDVDPCCVLCRHGNESFQHLFFKCDYSGGIWENILARFQLDRKAEPGIGNLLGPLIFAKEKASNPWCLDWLSQLRSIMFGLNGILECLEVDLEASMKFLTVLRRTSD